MSKDTDSEDPTQDWDYLEYMPCQPIGCDNGIHLPGCQFEKIDDDEEI